jgi:hypothetical protein
VISTRDYLVHLVRERLGRADERDEQVIDALFAAGLGQIRVSRGPVTGRLEAEQPDGDDVWIQHTAFADLSRPTLAEVLADMSGRTMRKTRCPTHGPQRGFCCVDAVPVPLPD